MGIQDGKMDRDGTWDEDPYRYGDTGPLTAAGLRAVSRSWVIVPPYYAPYDAHIMLHTLAVDLDGGRNTRYNDTSKEAERLSNHAWT